MQWSTIYLILAILAGGFGIWRIARGRNSFLGLLGILWFFIILFKFYVPDLFGLVLIKGIPTLGRILEYLLTPVFLLLAYVNIGPRR